MNLVNILADKLKPLTLNGLSILSLYKIPLFLGLFSGLCFLFAYLLIKSVIVAPEPIQIITQPSSDVLSNTNIQITIDIEGTVVNPGLYKLPQGSRLADAIAVAGGLSPEADTETITKSLNLAQKLSDGQKIYLSRLGDTHSTSSNKNIELLINTTKSNFININTSSNTELESLPGIGPVTAAKIIAGRPYSTLEELISKKVVGEKLFKKIKDQLTL